MCLQSQALTREILLVRADICAEGQRPTAGSHVTISPII